MHVSWPCLTFCFQASEIDDSCMIPPFGRQIWLEPEANTPQMCTDKGPAKHPLQWALPVPTAAACTSKMFRKLFRLLQIATRTQTLDMPAPFRTITSETHLPLLPDFVPRQIEGPIHELGLPRCAVDPNSALDD